MDDYDSDFDGFDENIFKTRLLIFCTDDFNRDFDQMVVENLFQTRAVMLIYYTFSSPYLLLL